MATLAELLDQARLDLDDPIIGADDTDCRWSDEELTDYINRSQSEACLRANILEDTGVSPWGKIKVKSGDNSYNLDKRILRVRRAIIDGESQPLVRRGYADLDYTTTDWESQTGTPVYLVQDRGTKSIRLVPTPDADKTLLLTVQRLPSRDMQLSQKTGETPEVPLIHHWHLLDYVYYLAYRRRDDDTHNPDLSRFYLEEFGRNFGDRPTAEDIEHNRTGRPMQVRGQYF